MLRTRPLQLAGEPEAHQAVHRPVGDLEPELAREPLSDLPVAVEAFACQALLKRVQRGRPQHLLPWLHSRLTDLQQALQPASLVRCEPVADAVSMQAEVLGRGFSAAHPAGGDQDQQVDAPLPLRILRPRQQLRQRLEWLANLRQRSAHGLLRLRSAHNSTKCTVNQEIWYNVSGQRQRTWTARARPRRA